MSCVVGSLRIETRLLRILEDSQNSREFSGGGASHGLFVKRILAEIIPSGSKRTIFIVGRAAGGTFAHFPSLSEPGGSKRSRIELKTQSKMSTRPNLSVWTAESFVLTPAPVGTQQQQPLLLFRALPRVRPGGETGRPVPKSILIGAPIPYAERA